MRLPIMLCISVAWVLASCATLPESCNLPSVGSLDRSINYAGLSARGGPNAEPADTGVTLARLQCDADRGQADAQTELARRYHYGLGVEQDLDQAIKLYKWAAAPISDKIAIYMPPVKEGAAGMVQTFDNPAATPGDPRAQLALAQLYWRGEGVKQDRKRAIRLLEWAAKHGHLEAQQALDRLDRSLVEGAS